MIKCLQCGSLLDDWITKCPRCNGQKFQKEDIEPFKKEWDNPGALNPYVVTLSSGSATLSSDAVIQQWPSTFYAYIDWSKAAKVSDITI